ncbi:NAD(P)-dependent oxidoreductase [Porphyromonas sp.]|uniref:NAD(P)-dependent oxidoreductase n=1 Tax=Porphyromonas sp. TaxID=1924944 RepID=UPI0026DB6368|nr:NAD(P)-dependent oxidoreductase [Porphyromonas sp.]MDO4695369.1 NAD(P)-dependent oxidoreductase [Porphyromonas sp.]MDO4770370.1 NAD(P)-dependent oxidoreductase [Porphyromonas sp.]
MDTTISKKRILIVFDTVQEGFEELYERYEVVRPTPGKSFTKEELETLGGDFDIIATEFSIPVDKEYIDRYPHLKMIANYAVGYNNIDLAHARSRDIAVSNTPKSVVMPTAELTLALLLNCTRRVAEWDRTMRHNKSSAKANLGSGMGVDLYGKTVGIIGYGNIGKTAGKYYQAFGMKVLYYKRNRLSVAEEQELRVTYATLDEIYAQSDVISLHTPYNPDSHHLINADAINKMKSNAIIINVARGAVVDEAALVEALKSGRIAGAGLDVFEHNDNPLSELYELDNVTMTPHVGTQTYDSRVKMAKELSDNIIGFLEGDRPVSLVS